MTCCKPAERDEDRTHHVAYSQEWLRDGEVVGGDQGNLEVACTHNDAVALADMHGQSDRFDVGMKPRGSGGTWMGSEILEGDGQRAKIWVERGLAEIEYDEQRAANPENWPCAYGPDHLAGVGYRLLDDGRAVCPELCWTETKEN